MSKYKLNKIERAMLKVLHEHKMLLTIGKVADLAGISWNTAEKYLKEFHKKGWIATYKRGKRTYYSAYKFR